MEVGLTCSHLELLGSDLDLHGSSRRRNPEDEGAGPDPPELSRSCDQRSRRRRPEPGEHVLQSQEETSVGGDDGIFRPGRVDLIDLI